MSGVPSYVLCIYQLGMSSPTPLAEDCHAPIQQMRKPRHRAARESTQLHSCNCSPVAWLQVWVLDHCALVLIWLNRLVMATLSNMVAPSLMGILKFK